MPKTPSLKDFRRIVVKVGSSLLVDSSAGRPNADWLGALAADIAALHNEKRDVLVVSSGAIALGRAVLKLPAGLLKLEDGRLRAVIAQAIMAAYEKAIALKGASGT
jgi:glutamate 5-kinase